MTVTELKTVLEDLIERGYKNLEVLIYDECRLPIELEEVIVSYREGNKAIILDYSVK